MSLPPGGPYGGFQQQPPAPQGYDRFGGYQQQPPQQQPAWQAPPQQGWQQPGPQHRPPRKRHTVRNVVAGVAGGFVVLIVVAAIAGGRSGGSGSAVGAADSSPAAAAASASAPASPAAAPAPAKPVAPHVIATFSGNGINTTAKFSVPADWVLDWSYNCASFGSQGNFAVLEDGGKDFSGADVNQLGNGGTGATHVYGDAPGQHYLEVDSECDWTLKVTG